MKIEPLDFNEKLTNELAIKRARIHLRSSGLEAEEFKSSRATQQDDGSFHVAIVMRHFQTGAWSRRVLHVQEAEHRNPGLTTKVTDITDQVQES